MNKRPHMPIETAHKSIGKIILTRTEPCRLDDYCNKRHEKMTAHALIILQLLAKELQRITLATLHWGMHIFHAL